jgi:hypoxanthine phosphoribosyltransferase
MRELLSAKDIQTRVCELAQEIDEAYQERQPVLVGIMKGSLHFLSDLSRNLKVDHTLEFLRASTYPSGSSPEPETTVESWSGFDVTGKEVLVVDDILDRGMTAKAISGFLTAQSPRSVTWVFLVVKEGAVERTGLRPEFIGFEIPNVWVVGYGMDYEERYRNLGGIQVYNPELDSQ